MSAREAFPQLRMERMYGFFHYFLKLYHDGFFRGEVAGLENIPATGAFIVASNHASHLDPPLIGAVATRQMAFFARKTLWRPGIPAWWMTTVGAIPVDRGGADLAAIKRVIITLNAGRPIALFPEGTRSADGKLQPAKSGVGLIACKTGVPVVPCHIFNSHIAYGRDGSFRPGTQVHIVFGRPLLPADYDVESDGKERFQRASERIMKVIATIPAPPVTVI